MPGVFPRSCTGVRRSTRLGVPRFRTNASLNNRVVCSDVSRIVLIGSAICLLALTGRMLDRQPDGDLEGTRDRGHIA